MVQAVPATVAVEEAAPALAVSLVVQLFALVTAAEDIDTSMDASAFPSAVATPAEVIEAPAVQNVPMVLFSWRIGSMLCRIWRSNLMTESGEANATFL